MAGQRTCPEFAGMENERASAAEMDEKRQQNIAYEYLCHLEEAKVWIETCISEVLPPTTELEEFLRNGVCLAKLSNYFAPKTVPEKKIYDIDLTRFNNKGLHFRHTDNIHHWLAAMEEIGLPKAILPETTDVYDRKNMPRVIYCLHALSLFLYNLGLAPKIQDLYGKVNFTEEEISTTRIELEKNGIQMPAFSTIGGVLANEIPVNEAVLHAAIIAVNEAIDNNDKSALLVSLQNPECHFSSINPVAIDIYYENFSSRKREKMENCRNRLISSEGTRDVYDEMLTSNELQDCLCDANCNLALQLIRNSLQEQDVEKLLKALSSDYLDLKNIVPKNVKFYFEELTTELNHCIQDNNNETVFTKECVQETLNRANDISNKLDKKNSAIQKINIALENGTAHDLLVALQSSDAGLPPVKDIAAELYFEEFSNNRHEGGTDLEYDELFGGINVLNAVVLVNMCIEAGDPNETYDAMKNNDAHIMHLDYDCKQRYQTALYKAKRHKEKSAVPCSLLTHLEIQDCIFIINKQVQAEQDKISAIHNINSVLALNDYAKSFEALCNSSLGIINIDERNTFLYHCLLLKELNLKTSSANDQDDVALWFDDIQHTIDKANELSSVALKCCKAISAINASLDAGMMEKFCECLRNPDAQLISVTLECMERYMMKLSAHKKSKLETGTAYNACVEYKCKDGLSLCYDVDMGEAKWCPSDLAPNTSLYLSRSEIQNAVTSITSQYDHELLCKAVEPVIVKLQSFIRGYCLRSVFRKRMKYLHANSASVIIIQAYWKGYRQRIAYQGKLNFLKNNIEKIVKVQAMVRRYLATKAYRSRLEYFRQNVSAVIKIQTCWRASKTRKAFQELTTSEKPSFSTVQMFVHLLDINNVDFSEELELYYLRSEVVKCIKHNQQLEKDLCTMDIKIGLLVKNRITLQDVVAHGKKLDKKSKEGMISASSVGQHGLKSLSKESRQKVEAYQHLFYLLQTEPRYLSHLIFLMLPSKTSKFIETVIQTLYNYASNQREEYLLLKLFKAALQEEIRCKVDQLNDIIMGNPLIIKMIVGFNRNKRGQSSLRELLGPLVRNVLDNKTLHINTNPVEVYKAWVNQLETQTGEPSGLPYNVTQEQALKHKEVWQQLNESVKSLKDTTLMFFNDILDSLDKIPYGILYMAKILKTSLEDKFPDAPQMEVLKVVGNLLYYRYINSAIVAPDAFGIVDIGANQSLTNDQRRNLGSVAKVLQFAASNNRFGDDSPHLVSLNPFILECHEKFKKFFHDACNVPELESHFKIFEYTEATMMIKPVIYISLQEICEMHMLLLEHQNSLAPHPQDPLHELLEDLGEKPTVEALLGENLEDVNTAQLARTEVCLTLSNKFEVPKSTKNDVNHLYVRTKQMIVDVMHCLDVRDIPEMLSTNITDDQNKLYARLLTKRQAQDETVETDKTRILCRNTSDGNCSTLEEVIDKIRHNLNVLELEGCITSKNNYQDMINTISLDIRNRRRYRIRRKQDLMHLKTTLTNLQTKTAFFEDQVEYYNQYIKQCLENMSTLRKKAVKGRQNSEKKVKSKISLKYTAAKLYEKGVILSMEGLSTSQFKNVLFEITPSEMAGVFGVQVRYMGTNLSDVELDIQNLLELQYEGVSVTTMFERAEVNVNLLLHLLNTKFYGKSK